jgi:hypothetical protein
MQQDDRRVGARLREYRQTLRDQSSGVIRATSGVKLWLPLHWRLLPHAEQQGQRMATKDPGEAVGEMLADILKIVFSLIFPLLLITLCGASFVLSVGFHLPEFALWVGIAMWALEYAKTNIWAALGLGAFVLASLPLAWVGFREQELRASSTIFAYVMAALIFGFLLWLRTVWPYNGSGWQLILYGLVMFAGWQATVDAVIGTLGILAHVRRNRPRPIDPPRQRPHGGPREERRSRDEAETI